MNHTDPNPAANLDLILRRFEEPDEVREMTKGRFEIVLGR